MTVMVAIDFVVVDKSSLASTREKQAMMRFCVCISDSYL